VLGLVDYTNVPTPARKSAHVELLTFGLIVIFLLGALAALASGVGVDSRDLSDDARRSSYPVSLS
jgi:hypothetical protein